MEGCMICGSKNRITIHKGTRGRKDIDVLRCSDCGLIYLSSMDEDYELFYQDSGMRKGKVDINAIIKTTAIDDERRYDFVHKSIINKLVLDFGCGAGGFLSLAKKSASDVIGVELEKATRDYINECGISCYPALNDIPDIYHGKVDVITMFHVLEHLKNPIELLNAFRPFLTKQGKIIIEVPNADDALLSLYDCASFADFTYWECHLFLYTNDTLRRLIEKTDYYKISFIKQIQRYNLSNTLYWLSKGKPGGHELWNMLNEKELDESYGMMLAKLGKADTIVAELIISN